MKNTFIVRTVAATLLFVAPLMARADVVTQDILNDIRRQPGNDAVWNNRQETCNASKAIVKGQMNPVYGQSVAPKTEWRSVSAQNGIVLSIPWSPYWYIVGKQIPWFDQDDSENPITQYWFGKYQTEDGCGLTREYYANIYANTTLAAHFAKSPKDDTTGTIIEKFEIGGRPAALANGTNPFCDQESLAIQVMKKKKPYTIVFSHQCGSLTSEMIRMAARVK